MKIFKILGIFILFMFLFACSSTMENNSKIEVTNKGNFRTTENIKQIIAVDNKVYVIADKYDYEFSGKEADILKDIVYLQKTIGFNKKDKTETYYEIFINMKGEVEFELDDYFSIYKVMDGKAKVSEAFLQEQAEKVKKIRNKLKERNVNFNLREDSEYYTFTIRGELKAKGKVVKLDNRDEILAKMSSNIKTSKAKLIIEYEISQEEYNSRLKAEKYDIIEDKVSRVLSSVLLVGGIILLF